MGVQFIKLQKLDLETTLKATTLNHLVFINLGINLSTNSN